VTQAVPRFSELPFFQDTKERHAWDVWGRQDNLGSMNRVGPAEVRHAATLVRTGKVISLTLPLNEPDPGLFPNRRAYVRTDERTSGGRDDKVDNLYLQFSSQWDGLRHVKIRGSYWGGRTDEEVDATASLGIEHWSQRGPIGRGVLIDVARHFERLGNPLSMTEKFEIDGDLIDQVALAQGVTFGSGDFLVLRTGWTAWYRAQPAQIREAMAGSVGNGFACPGLESSQATMEYLWNRGFAAVAADNVACECLPVDRQKGFLHRRLIPLMGMGVGEFWYLDELSRHCAESGVYDFMLVSAALRIPGADGSPANAYAIV